MSEKNIVVTDMKVRVDEDHDQHELKVEFDFSGCTDEQMATLATANAKVRFATRLRKLGDRALAKMAKEDLVKCNAADLFTRAEAQPATLEQQVDRMSIDQAQEALKLLKERLGIDD